MQKHVNLVDLVKSFPTNIYLQNLASIQRRTSPVKFAHLAEKSGNGSISNLSTKAKPDAKPDAKSEVKFDAEVERRDSKKEHARFAEELPADQYYLFLQPCGHFAISIYLNDF